MKFLNPPYTNILMGVLLCTLGLCGLYIGKLRRLLAREKYRRLNPQLSLQLAGNPTIGDPGLYLCNESDFLIKDAHVEDVALTFTDFNVTQTLNLRFEQIGFLKPKEKIQLNYKAFDRDNRFLSRISQNLLAHLLSASFAVRIRYTQAEGRTLLATFCKQREKFFCEKIELIK